MDELLLTLLDPKTEDHVLGALLAAPYAEVLDLLAALPSDPGWTHDVRADLHRAIGHASRRDDGGTHDLPALRRALIDDRHQTGPNGEDIHAWLLDLDQWASPHPEERAAAVERLAQITARRRLRQTLIDHANQLIAGGDAEAVGAAVSTEVERLNTKTKTAWYELGALGEQVMDRWAHDFESGNTIEWSSGSTDVDRKLSGLRRGFTYIIGGRPGQGKTVAAIDLARALLKQGAGVAFFSAEMQAHHIIERMVQAEVGYDHKQAIANRDTDSLDKALSVAHARSIEWANLLRVTDSATGPLTWQRIAALVRREQKVMAAQGVELVAFFVDYMQILPQATHSGRRQLDVREHLSEIAQGLSAVGKETNTMFFGVSQVKRPDSAGSVKAPTMFDLKESSDLEQAADAIILLHRPDMYDPEDRPGVVDWIIAKHRHGESGTIERAHQLQYYRMADIAHRSDWSNQPVTRPNDPDTF